MKVLFASSEISPYASTGGLGDVAQALPRALRESGATVWSVMPFYRQVAESGLPQRDTGLRLRIPLGFDAHPAEIWVDDRVQPPVYFVRRDEFFDRHALYSLPERDYDDNFARFTFFQKAVVALVDHLGLAPDIVHGNDWTTGLLPHFLRHGIDGMGRTCREKCVFTIHNLAYQGIFPASMFSLTNLPFSCFSIAGVEFFGRINCLKGGLTGADVATTVSRGYAREIRTPEFGCGLEGLLQAMDSRLVGIPNGVDYDVWDPAHDRFLPAAYSPADLAGKTECKVRLAGALGLTSGGKRPMIGFIARLTDQKGLDILSEGMDALMALGADFVLLGSGQQAYHNLCRTWTERWPGRFHATIGFDTRLAHRIEAASDLLLMPSRFEPCGLAQLYALRYGTVPVVHATGGLDDTVRSLTPDGAEGNGFKFSPYTPEALVGCVKEALDLHARPKAWLPVVRRIMREDHSWRHSAKSYMALYDAVCGSAV